MFEVDGGENEEKVFDADDDDVVVFVFVLVEGIVLEDHGSELNPARAPIDVELVFEVPEPVVAQGSTNDDIPCPAPAAPADPVIAFVDAEEEVFVVGVKELSNCLPELAADFSDPT